MTLKTTTNACINQIHAAIRPERKSDIEIVFAVFFVAQIDAAVDLCPFGVKPFDAAAIEIDGLCSSVANNDNTINTAALQE